MSLNINPLEVMAVMDPRLEIESKRSYVAVKGALVNSWTQFPATNVNNSSFQITCNPPNRDIAISRLVFQKVTFNFSISGSNSSGGTLLNSGYIAPRAMPLTSVLQSCSITINNDTITQAPIQQYWRALLRYRNDWEERFKALSLAPSMLDQFQDYAEGAGTVRNPLAAYGDNSFEQTRGSYAGFTIDPQTPGNTTATGTLTTYEPILVSPFVWGDRANYYAGFAGIQNMSYNATIGNLQRILSVVQGQGVPTGQIFLNSPNVSVSSASLFFNYLTPDPVMPIPRNMESSYYSLISYPTRFGSTVQAGATINIPFQSVQVSSIPKRMYIFAKRDDSIETAFTSDTFLSLPKDVNPLSVQWNNNQFLSQASTQDLYNISVKNGVNMSYSQFVDKCGSVLAIDFGTDVGLMSNQAPGVIGNYQLGFTCQFTNTSSEAITNVTLYCVVVSEGVFNVTDGSCSHMIGVLSPQDILDADILPMGSYRKSEDIYGGKFERLKSFLSKANQFAKKSKIISKGLEMAGYPGASKAAQALGYGSSGGSVLDYGGSLPSKQNKRKVIKTGSKLSDLA